MYRTFRACALALCLAGSALAAPAASQSDKDFLAARAAFERGDRGRLDALAPKLADHVLAPYVEFWQRIASARHCDRRRRSARSSSAGPKSPLADRLRVDWLKALGKRGQWATFAALTRRRPARTSSLRVTAMQYRRQRDGDVALGDAKPLWFTGQATPESCEPLFAALIAKGELTVDDRRTRFRLATEAGNVRVAQAIADGPAA